MVKTRLWLGGEVSEQRDLPLVRWLIERVRCVAAHPLLFCTDGLYLYIRAIRETFRDPVPTGKGGRPVCSGGRGQLHIDQTPSLVGHISG